MPITKLTVRKRVGNGQLFCMMFGVVPQSQDDMVDFEMKLMDFEMKLVDIDSEHLGIPKAGFARIYQAMVDLPSLPVRRLRSSLCLQFKPHQIAAGAAYLAAKSMNMDLTSSQHVWQEFQTPPSVLKGWVKTAMTGWAAGLSPEEGAETTVWLALLPDHLVTGTFFFERKVVSCYDDDMILGLHRKNC
ncbi:hypothetical protein AgCh_011608 [Apium graveolens]